jgi:hypothetical protein
MVALLAAGPRGRVPRSARTRAPTLAGAAVPVLFVARRTGLVVIAASAVLWGGQRVGDPGAPEARAPSDADPAAHATPL